jgi:hypothetical protein
VKIFFLDFDDISLEDGMDFRPVQITGVEEVSNPGRMAVAKILMEINATVKNVSVRKKVRINQDAVHLYYVVHSSGWTGR